MRMERLSMMFVKDWIRPAGPASEMAGQNGELDPICGSVEYHDEMTEEFSSNAAPRLEYLKRKASDNAFQRLRTCPELVNGQTRYRTKLLWSVHYETTVFSTNRGMCGTKEDEEPDANRAALVDRTVAQQARTPTDLYNHLIVCIDLKHHLCTGLPRRRDGAHHQGGVPEAPRQAGEPQEDQHPPHHRRAYLPHPYIHQAPALCPARHGVRDARLQ